MNPTSSIVIGRSANMRFGCARSFLVWIDGQRAGRNQRGVRSQFDVLLGEHEVAISMDWVRSRPLQVVAEPGSRTELMIGFPSRMRSKFLRPIVIISVVAQLIINGLLATRLLDENWWMRMGISIAVYGAIFVGYVLVTSWFVRDYWNLFTLEPAEPTSPTASDGG